MQNDELRKRNYSSAGALTSNKGKMLWLNLFCVDGLQKVSPWEKMALFYSKRYLYIVQFRGWTVPA